MASRPPRQQKPSKSIEKPLLTTATRKKLKAWFVANQRDMPWRLDRDPYKIWVSEIMLQQTQVETVRPYFERFLRRFPNVAALAQAEEQEVLKHWEGLGYYRRARNLHAAAREIVAHHQAQFPRELEQAMALPGVGRYTAGAVLSIAYGVRTPILEANTIRLFSRLLALRGDPRTAEAQQRLWNAAEQILPRGDCGWFNQALMELGSLICRPKEPRCDECALRSACEAYRVGAQSVIPAGSRKPTPQNKTEAVIMLFKGNRVLMRNVPTGERWAGLWDFVRFEVTRLPNLADHKTLDEQLLQGIFQITGLSLTELYTLPTLRHGVTRFRIELLCRWGVIEVGSGQRLSTSQAHKWKWAPVSELELLPLSTTAAIMAQRAAELVLRQSAR